jgi:hypothetical protein
MNKFFFLVMFMLCFSGFSLSQDKGDGKQKKHYSIVSSDSKINLSPFEMALSASSQLDQFRLYDQRRIISFERNSVSVELFSAKELEENFGKQISPKTIMKKSEMIPVIFLLKEVNGIYSIEPVYQKK